MTANTTIAEKLVAKAKELGLPPQSETFIRQADTAVTDAVRKTAAYTEQNREKISEGLKGFALDGQYYLAFSNEPLSMREAVALSAWAVESATCPIRRSIVEV